MNTLQRWWITAGAVLLLAVPVGAGEPDPSTSLGVNVLMIAVDDLRPELACYGQTQLKTPHIDRLAARGVHFVNAHCNIAVCGASRASIMKGLRPTPTRFTSYLTRADRDAPEVPSLPALLKQRGYVTLSNGKIYHHKGDDPAAWSEPAWRSDKPTWLSPANRALQKQLAGKPEGKWKRPPPTECGDFPDHAYGDGDTAGKTIRDLERLAGLDKPFFLACGFVKPHLPFVAPKAYWDLYPPETIRLPDNMYFPHDLDRAFAYTWGEMRSYHGIPAKGAVSQEQARNLIRGYYACVSFIDAQVGRLLDALDRLGLAGNTVVLLWGDHGWQLGEHAMWCKHTNFEVATRVPLIFAGPGVHRGGTAAGLVEYVDVYPTVCDLLSIPQPGHLQGASLTAMLGDPSRPGKPFVQTRHGGGDALRTEHFRYMEMRSQGGRGEYLANALFDLKRDPDENQCVVDDPAYAAEAARMKERLTENMIWTHDR